jgi:hypothetical protein
MMELNFHHSNIKFTFLLCEKNGEEVDNVKLSTLLEIVFNNNLKIH